MNNPRLLSTKLAAMQATLQAAGAAQAQNPPAPPPPTAAEHMAFLHGLKAVYDLTEPSGYIWKHYASTAAARIALNEIRKVILELRQLAVNEARKAQGQQPNPAELIL